MSLEDRIEICAVRRLPLDCMLRKREGGRRGGEEERVKEGSLGEEMVGR